jgi:citrate lyase subunit beta/citryl-CoA lyase
LEAFPIAQGPRVRHLQIGEYDLAADLGVVPGQDGAELLFARSQVVTVSAASGIDPPVAPVSVELRNLVAFKESTTALRRLGFVGRACVHPVQLGPVHEVFTPTQAELEHAHRTLAQLDEAGRQSSGVLIGEDGRLIDEAVARSARRLLESAKLR